MSAVGLLFVTAPSADNKAINRLLLHLRNWNFGGDDTFHIVPTKDMATFKSALESGSVDPTDPPCPDDITTTHQWQNASLEEVESFVLNLDNSNLPDEVNANVGIYVLLDDKGLQDKTCIVGERAWDDEAENRLDVYEKARVPWEEVHAMWANLDIANMNFDDFCDQDQGRDENYWWRWEDSEIGAGIGIDEGARPLRDEALKKLEFEGRA